METICPHWNMFVAQSLQGRQIFKDECIRCFHTPKSPGGLNICLTCLQGSCSEKHQGEEMTHQQIHYANTYCGAMDQHPLSMNIKMTRKVTTDQQPVKITKLAIGMPGGIDAEQDKYDTKITAHCAACNKDLPTDTIHILDMLNSVMQAQSAFNTDTVKEWEQELNECSHTQNLDQSSSVKIADKSLAHCAECDLKSNLWLCMACGHLGCGRKNFGGTGGNNHAIDHAHSSHHPVVCKLGTITPEGSASIYCYDCDDEVLDKNLGSHLSKLGIQITSQVKTEKSMTELNLEANLSLTLSKVLEEGKTLIPVFGSDRTGMINLGNTCYMNSVVQVIFSLPEFKEYFSSRADDHLKSCKNLCSNCYLCQFSKLAKGLYSGEFSSAVLAEKTDENQEDEHYQEGIRPQMFKSMVGKGHKEFQTGQQQDAREYFDHFMSFMQKGEKALHACDPTKAFDFEYETTYTCSQCNSFKKKSEKETILKLQVPVSSKVEPGTAVELELCLQNHFADSQVDDLFCSMCNKKTQMIAQKRFKSFPKNLVVVLWRFVVDQWVPKKLDIELNFDSESTFNFQRFAEPVATFGSQMPDEQQDVEMVEPPLPMEVVHELMEMGISENQAKHSVYNAGINAGAEMAIMWFYENIENPLIQGPLLVIKSKAPEKKEFSADPESIMMIESMGLTSKQAIKALKNCDGNVERAIDWIFSHMDDPVSENEMEIDQSQAIDNNPFECKRPDQGMYKLHGFITHLGASVHAGHYVSHIKIGGKWIYFNDAKVAESADAPFGKGYIYVFSKL